MDNGNSIRLLAIYDSANQADEIASALKDFGVKVRSTHIANMAALQQALKTQAWDMLITAAQAGDLGADQSIAAIKESGKDIPCIIYDDNIENHVADYLKAGALDVVASSNLEHLHHVVHRETGNLRERRLHRRCRALYHETEKRNKSLLETSRDPIAYLHEGAHIYSNQRYQDYFAYTDAKELDSTPILDLVAPVDQDKLKDILRDLGNGVSPETSVALHLIDSKGEQHNAAIDFSPTSIKGEPCVQIIIRSGENSGDLEKEIQQLRQRDLLTGLYNHQYFLDQLQNAVDQSSQGEKEFSILYIVPDNFNNLKNDLGLTGSDLILTDIAKILQSCTPQESLLARYGNAAFTLLLNEQQAGKSKEIAEDILRRVSSKIFDSSIGTLTATCSIGIAKVTETAASSANVLAKAESACSHVTENHGNQYHEFSEQEEAESLALDRDMTPLIHNALKENLFLLQYQPIVSLHAEPGDRYEVLVRMHDEENNIIMPGEFLGTAQRANMMKDIDRWVIKTAAKAILSKRKINHDMQFFIKISQDSLSDSGTLIWISKLLKAARLHGDCLVFEISERNVLNNLKAAKIFSDGLKQLHCHMAIDHGGQETSDFSYLKHLNIDYLKIDGSHVQNVKSEESQDIMRDIVQASRDSNFLTIAEHVQDPDCLATLWMHGVNFIQGFYLQQPENGLDYDFTSTNK